MANNTADEKVELKETAGKNEKPPISKTGWGKIKTSEKEKKSVWRQMLDDVKTRQVYNACKLWK